MWDSSLRDKLSEQRLFRFRAYFMLVVVVLMFMALLARMAYLQIQLHEKYTALSENNRIQTWPIAPTRGLIFDRNGELLAENVPSYSLTLVSERVPDLDSTLDFIDQLIGLTEQDYDQIHKRLEQRRRPYEPIIIRQRLTEEEIAKIMVNRYFLKGVDVEAQLVRHYPHGDEFAHVLGYVGRINRKEQNTLDQEPERKIQYSATHFIGKTGIERFYERDLHGQVGYQEVETNARGRIIRVVNKKNPVPGSDITLHLDTRIQTLTKRVMEGRRGAVVAIEVATGGIVAMYSNPSFDPNDFVLGISHKKYQALRNDPDLPLFNRTSRGQYPPASTIKPYIGLALLQAKTTNWSEQIKDRGFFTLPNDNRIYRDWKRSGHGMVNLETAVVESCDTYFYDMSVRTGVDLLTPFLSQFGFGRNTALDITDALPGLLPDRAWKKRKLKRSWYAGDTVNFGIGQGYMLATPVQMATAAATLAGKGIWHTPRLMESMNNQPVVLAATQAVTLDDPLHWDKMFTAMGKVIDSPRGTARRLGKNMPYPIAAKTGTAQVVGIKQDEKYDSESLKERLRDHALFVAFAPIKDPTIAIAVVIENGESASKTAGPIAKSIINEYLRGTEN